MSRKLLIGMVVAVVAIVLVCAFGGRLVSRFAPTPTPTPGRVIALEESTVTAKGVIVPSRYVRLGFPIGGTLARLAVREGDLVKAGQVLAQLDTTDLELTVGRAEDALALAEAQLAQAKAPPRPEDIAAAEAGLTVAQAGVKQAQGVLASAQANLEGRLAGPTQEAIRIAKADLQTAEIDLQEAQAAYDQVAWMPGVSATSEAMRLWRTSTASEKAKATYEQIKAGARQEEIAAARAQVLQAQGGLEAARAQVAQAQAQLERAKAGPRPEDVAVAEAQVRQARTALEEARLALEKAKLVAPFSGAVVSVAAREGEIISPGATMITLAELSEMRVETTDLDELGVAQVKVGAPVHITVDAFKDKVLTGRVVAIALEGVTNPAGDVIYKVTITLDSQDPDLRWGMTLKMEFR